MPLPDKLKNYLLSIALDFLKDFGLAVGPELMPLVNEYLRERITPDGWTRRERGIYLLGVISRVRAKQIGNAATDRAFDWGLDALEDLVQDSIEETSEDDHSPVNPVPPVPPPVLPPPRPEPNPGEYEYMYDVIPDPSEWKMTDVLWYNQSHVAEAQRWMVLPAGQLGYPGWKKIDGWQPYVIDDSGMGPK